VAAANAVGVRISRIQYSTLTVGSRKRLRIVVTLRDANKRPIRGAIVTVAKVPGANSVARLHAALTGQLGRATFTVPLTNKLAGQRFLARIVARTPSTRTSSLASVRLPSQKA
jgi:hypothetical protein